MESLVIPTNRLPNSTPILRYVESFEFWLHGGFSLNTCISSLMVLWTFWEHAEDYEVANFCFSSDNIFELHRCILHIPKYHQPPSDRHHYWSPILCPNNLTYHFDIHYHKSSPNHKSKILCLHAIASGAPTKCHF